MSIFLKLTQLIVSLMPNIKSQKDFDDVYLSHAADIYDLERRMREIDQRSSSASLGLAYGQNLI
ncbi:MAG: DUF3563 family protein [Rhodoferax sp.]|uniref:DUF3563 family protein n=1 Tax=Rhodoferax sp. TaxID=50421 RepID=UPI001B4F5633|nr:DUF3563 family protein [Rhodoferax sp.]MBP9906033.1 DUF3563 family protein [Rhodoferax sp.]